MQYDVYAYGMISASTLHVLENKFPEADAYAEIRQTYRMVGGEAANSAIVMSRLGLKVKLDGNWLDNNEKGQFTSSLLNRYAIDTSRLSAIQDYSMVEENVFTDGLTRTNFGTYCNLLFNGRQWNVPNPDDVQYAEAVCLDPFFGDESLAVLRSCKAFGIPCVSIDSKYDSEISQDSDVMIIAGEFRRNEYRDCDKETLFSRYCENARGLVIFTSGAQEILYGRRGGPVNRIKPYAIDALDTTGAGDSFRSGVIYGLLKKWPEEKMICYAAAVAACVSLSFPGVLKSPGSEEVDDFIQRNPRPEFNQD